MNSSIGKKGMGISQVFIFIVAALTFALVMIFGFKVISGFISKGESVAFVQFKTDLEKSVKRISTEYGSVRKTSFTLPGNFDEVCFVNLDVPYKEDTDFCSSHPLACQVWQEAQSGPDKKKGYDYADENVFLSPSGPVKIKVHRLRFEDPNQGFKCARILQGQFSLMLEGQGDRTLIKIPQSE